MNDKYLIINGNQPVMANVDIKELKEMFNTNDIKEVSEKEYNQLCQKLYEESLK